MRVVGEDGEQVRQRVERERRPSLCREAMKLGPRTWRDIAC